MSVPSQHTLSFLAHFALIGVLPSAQVLGRPSGHGGSPGTLCGSEPSAQVGREPSSHLAELVFSSDEYYPVFRKPLRPNCGPSGKVAAADIHPDGWLPSAQAQVGLVPSSHLRPVWRLRPTRQPSRIREALMSTDFLLSLTFQHLLAAFYITVTSSTVNYVLILLLTGPKLFRIELTNSLP